MLICRLGKPSMINKLQKLEDALRETWETGDTGDTREKGDNRADWV